MAGPSDPGAVRGPATRGRERRLPPRGRRPLPRGGAGGRDPHDEGQQGHHGDGTVRTGNEALPRALRPERAMSAARVDADAALVEALRRDEGEAMERLVERYADRVYRLALPITRFHQDARKVKQEAPL